MTDKELRKLHREDLLQILMNQQQQIDDMAQALEENEKRLQDRRIAVENFGSLAEAALKLNDVFERAQQAADHYVEETVRRADEQRKASDEALATAQREAARQETQARREADRLVAEARREAEKIRGEAEKIRGEAECLMAEAKEKLAEAERKLAEANGQPDAKAESSGKLKGLFRRNK